MSETPSAAHFALDEPATVEFRATVPYSKNVESATPDLYFRVRVRGTSEPRDLECDPFANPKWLWRQGHHTQTRVFHVAMPPCTVDLDEGSYSITAERVWRVPRDESHVSETLLSLHEPSILSELSAVFH